MTRKLNVGIVAWLFLACVFLCSVILAWLLYKIMPAHGWLFGFIAIALWVASIQVGTWLLEKFCANETDLYNGGKTCEDCSENGKFEKFP